MEQNTQVTQDNRSAERWWAFLIIVMAADALVTTYLITHGLATEGNPVIRGAVSQLWFVGLKVVVGFIAGLILWRGGGRWRSRGIMVAALSMAFIVAWNVSIGVVV